jgi:hypothetical protein
MPEKTISLRARLKAKIISDEKFGATMRVLAAPASALPSLPTALLSHVVLEDLQRFRHLTRIKAGFLRQVLYWLLDYPQNFHRRRHPKEKYRAGQKRYDHSAERSLSAGATWSLPPCKPHRHGTAYAEPRWRGWSGDALDG